MKTMIYYFSATGNSLHVAKSICGQMEDCSLLSIASLYHEKTVTAKAQVIGLVFPTHYFGLPPIVTEFIEKLNLEGVKYTFAVVTSGSSRHLNSSLQQISRLLSQKGQTLHAGYHVEMISSYIPLSNIPPSSKIVERLAEADVTVQQIIRSVVLRKNERESEMLWRPFSAINKYWKCNQLSKAHSKFSCTASCTSCGNCVRVCPVENIKLKDGKPEWSENCQECLACLHLCPAVSIEFGTRTPGRKRYHHPNVSINELISLNQYGNAHPD